MKKIFLFIVSLFAILSVKGAFTSVTPYGEAQKIGVFDDEISVMYDKDVFFNNSQYSKLLSILEHPSIPSINLDSYVYKGYDQDALKTMIMLNADFTTATVAGAAVTFTLVLDDKFHITKNMILRLPYSASAGYTNEVYVADRHDDPAGTNNRTTISVKPTDATKMVGKSAGFTGYNTNYPRLNVVGTWFDDYSESVKPASTNPYLIYNYVQYQKAGYRYGKLAAKQNLYTAGSLRLRRDTQAKQHLLKLMQKTMLFGGQRYRSGITLPTEVNEFSKMYGLEDWILAEGTVNKLYTSTISTGLIDDFEEWLWGMNNTDIETEATKRLTACNNALIKWLTDVKTSKPGIELAPNDSYGIPGVTTVRWGNKELDLFVESAINEVHNNIEEPYAMALTPTRVKVAKMIPVTLEVNIQNRNVSGFESQYEVAWTYLLHGAKSSYHSIFMKG
jgi:hypothetical protein